MRKKIFTHKRLLSGLVILAMALTIVPATSMEAKAASISNPRIVEDSSMEAEQKVTWDCIYFGSYTQTEVVSEASQCGTYGNEYWGKESDYIVNATLYNQLKSATSYDAKGDITIDGVKYRRLKKGDATYGTSGDSGYYNWSDTTTYHYFRYEKIKWRVLNVDGQTAFLLADQALDDQKYNTSFDYVTWETSTIRSWLNGYGASSNIESTDYTSKNFIDSAFNSSEKSAILTSAVVNDDNSSYDTKGGNNTSDQIFLLGAEVCNTDTAASYGFVKSSYIFDEARRSGSSTYAKAMGTGSEYDDVVADYNGNCSWWLRSPGIDNKYAARVSTDGYVYYRGETVLSKEYGCRPALKLNLSSSNIYSYAGTVSTVGANVGTSKTEKITPTIKLSATKKTIKKKKSYTLKISGLAKGDDVKSVKTSKKSVATVKKVKKNQYKITGKKKGKATITVTLKSGKKATCKITVK